MGPSYLTNRLLRGVLVLWLVHLMTFCLIRLVPGDPAEIIAGDQATLADVERIRASLGLDVSLPAQYWDSLTGVISGDFGESIFSGIPVGELLLKAFPPSLSIAIVALLFATIIGIAAGAVAGLRHGTWVDRFVTTLTSFGIAMPNFWIGMVLVTIFSITLGWLPATSYVAIEDDPAQWFMHIILPATSLGAVVAAEIARHTRGGVVDVMSKPFVKAARARGSNGFHLVRSHVVRNVSIPVVTILGLTAGSLLGGTVIVESVFGISGLGNLAISSVLSRDYPVLQGFVLLAAAAVVLINIVVDFSYGVINPKVRKS